MYQLWQTNHLLTRYADATISVNKGQKSDITLPDGSVVTVNSDSRVSYGKNFNGKKRMVELVGEAFFNVAKDPSAPFYVKVGNLTIQAVGTAFNVHVPLITTSSQSDYNVSNEGTDDGVWSLIESDLEAAESVLPTTYSASDVGRATKGAAQAILAKVYLTEAGYPWVWNNDQGKGTNTGNLKTFETRRWMDEIGIKEHHVSWRDGLFKLD